jgi:RNA polymerase sigma-70 factor (ECF subfamily)
MLGQGTFTMQTAAVAVELDDLDDARLVALARQRHAGAFRLIMQRHNRRLFRVARSVLADDSEAEDVVQEAYLRAFTHLGEFRGEARLSTWLTRIALNEALGRLRRRRHVVDITSIDTINDQGEARVIVLPTSRQESDPEAAAARTEVRRLLERAVDQLPDAFRAVFVMRDIEEMNIEETAAHLNLRPETVKTRLHRARRLLRQALNDTLASAVVEAFPFGGHSCARLTEVVLERLGISGLLME